MATENSFAASPAHDRLPFGMPLVAAHNRFSAGAWRLRAPKQSRRKAGMWQVWDGQNDLVADVYSEADARLIVSSKALLLTCVKLLNTLRPLALEGRLTRGDVAKVHDAIEVLQREHLTASEVAPVYPPADPLVRVRQENAEHIDIDPAFRTWCAQQYRAATAKGLFPPPRSELRERYLRGER